MIFLEEVRRLAEDRDRMQQQVAEVAGVEGSESCLIGGVEFAALAVGKCTGVTLRDVVRQQPLVLPAVDHAGELFCRPAFVVQPFGLDKLLYQADHVIGVENGEVRAQADQFGVATQDLHPDRVECAKPGHALDGTADQDANTFLHLARGLVGEGHGKNLRRKCATRGQDMGNAGGQYACLAGAGACQDKNRAVDRFHGFALFEVEAGEIIRGGSCTVPCGQGACSDAQATLRRFPRLVAIGWDLRLARRCLRLFVEERDIVKTVTHQANVVIRGGKASRCSLFIPMFAGKVSVTGTIER